jgi:hypothetical protein
MALSLMGLSVLILLPLALPSFLDELKHYDYLYYSFREQLLLKSCISGTEFLFLDIFVQIYNNNTKNKKTQENKQDINENERVDSKNSFFGFLKIFNLKRLGNATSLGIFIHAPLCILMQEYVVNNRKQTEVSSYNIQLLNQLALVALYSFYSEMMND